MKKTTPVNLDKLIQDFNLLEQRITEVKGKNNMLEIKLDERSRLLKYSQNREKHLTEERDGLLSSVKSLQHNLQLQCDLRVENEKLKNDVLDLRKQNQARMEESRAGIEKLQGEMRNLRERHQREMSDCAAETRWKVEQKEAEMRAALSRKEEALEEMKKEMKAMEKEKQTEILKLQMEFSAKLARAQTMSLKTQQQPQGPGINPQNVFKRKLQLLQEEKNKEIESLRQRVKELEHQSLRGFSESRLKKRKM